MRKRKETEPVKMKTVNVNIYFCASKTVPVEVPENLVGDGLGDYLKAKLDKNLPEVNEGSTFEYPRGFQIVGEEEEWELD